MNSYAGHFEGRRRGMDDEGDEDEEDWRLLLEQYLPPAHPHGDPDAGDLPDDAPWRAALRAAARQGPAASNGATPDARAGQSGPRRVARPWAGGPDANGTSAPVPSGPRAVTGDRVAVTSLAGLRGTVLAVSGEVALVETAAARVHARIDDLVVLAVGHDMRGRPTRPNLVRQRREPSGDCTVTVGGRGNRRQPRRQGIDLHGLTLSDALARLDDFLFSAWEEERLEVAIIHGKGAGTLRQAVRAMLAAHPAVHHQQAAPAHGGGEGVTIVHLHAIPDAFHIDR